MSDYSLRFSRRDSCILFRRPRRFNRPIEIIHAHLFNLDSGWVSTRWRMVCIHNSCFRTLCWFERGSRLFESGPSPIADSFRFFSSCSDCLAFIWFILSLRTQF
jgi:hypothetical protein